MSDLLSFELPSVLIAKSLINLLQMMRMLPHDESRWMCRDGLGCTYRRLIPKSAFMQFLAILTFLHICKNKSQGYLKMQGPWQFLQNKGV